MWTHPTNPALAVVALPARRAEDLPAGLTETLRAAAVCAASDDAFDLVELVRMPARTYRADLAGELPAEGLLAVGVGELARLGIDAAAVQTPARPLTGLTVVVTRAAHQVAPLAALLEAAGASVVALPAIATEAPADLSVVDASLRGLGSTDAVVFTSENGALCTFERLRALALDARVFSGKLVAAIGPGTAKALAREGLRADLVPEEHVGEALAAALVAALPPERHVTIFRATEARDALPRLLEAAGHRAQIVPVYTTVRDFDAKRFVQLTETRTRLAVTCTSASTATSLLEALDAAGARAALAGVGVISIGPITSEALAARGVVANGEARPYTLAGVVAAMVAWYEGVRSFPGAAP